MLLLLNIARLPALATNFKIVIMRNVITPLQEMAIERLTQS